MNHSKRPPLARVVQLAAGARNLREWWLSRHRSVSQETADSRAKICQACPLNESEDLFDELTAVAAVVILRAFERKKAMKLHLQGEEQLRICGACGCDLKLKVWEPKELIDEQMSAKQKEALHPSCWILE